MLWYDDDGKRRLDEKVARAVAHYRAKYGLTPTLCFVHPSLLPAGPEVAAGVQIRPAHTVMINHFWIGVDDLAARPERSGGHGHRARRGSAGEERRLS
jgi:hypothetical protein